MALIIPTGTTEVAVQIRRTGDPDPWYVTFAVDSINYLEDPEGLRDLIETGFCGQLEGRIPSDTAFTGIQLRVGNTGGDPLTLFYSINVPGIGSGTTLPQNCAVLLNKVTTRPGRTGKGRMYWPTIPEADVNGLGQIDGTVVSGWNTTLAAVLENLANPAGDEDPAPMCLLHNTGAPGGTDPTPIVGLTCAPIIATQRRRLRR